MKRKIPNTITEEEFVKLIKKVRKQHHRIAFILGFYQAMRVSEIVNIKPEDVKFNEHIIQLKEAKGKKDRHIPIMKPILMGDQTVIRALKHLPIPCGIRALQIAFNNYTEKILGKRLNIHTLRHSGLTWLHIKKKWDIRKVQQFAGHSKIETTLIYSHVTPQDLVELEWEEE